jgi:hypothetical protein
VNARGHALGRCRVSEEQRRRRIASELEAELVDSAKAFAAADHTTPEAWGHLVRLENGLLTLAQVDPALEAGWRALATRSPLPPPGFVRLSAITDVPTDTDDPPLHPRHAQQVVRSSGRRGRSRAFPSPGLRRPGEQLELEIDGQLIVLPSVYHRLGSIPASRSLSASPYAGRSTLGLNQARIGRSGG